MCVPTRCRCHYSVHRRSVTNRLSKRPRHQSARCLARRQPMPPCHRPARHHSPEAAQVAVRLTRTLPAGWGKCRKGCPGRSCRRHAWGGRPTPANSASRSQNSATAMVQACATGSKPGWCLIALLYALGRTAKRDCHMASNAARQTTCHTPEWMPGGGCMTHKLTELTSAGMPTHLCSSATSACPADCCLPRHRDTAAR